MSDYSIRDDRTLRGWPLPHADNYLQDDVLRLRDAITSIDSAVTQLDSTKTDSAALTEALASKADIASLDLKADASALTEHVSSSSPHGFKSSAIELLNTLDPQFEDVGKALTIASGDGGTLLLKPKNKSARAVLKPVGTFPTDYVSVYLNTGFGHRNECVFNDTGDKCVINKITNGSPGSGIRYLFKDTLCAYSTACDPKDILHGFFGGRWYLTNGAKIYSSLDGIAFILEYTGTQVIYQMAETNGIIRAYANNSTVFSRSQSGTWSESTNKANLPVNANGVGMPVKKIGSVFVGTNSYNALMKSSDGLTWDLIPIQIGAVSIAGSLAMANRKGGGYVAWNTINQAVESDDMITWRPVFDTSDYKASIVSWPSGVNSTSLTYSTEGEWIIANNAGYIAAYNNESKSWNIRSVTFADPANPNMQMVATNVYNIKNGLGGDSDKYILQVTANDTKNYALISDDLQNFRCVGAARGAPAGNRPDLFFFFKGIYVDFVNTFTVMKTCRDETPDITQAGTYEITAPEGAMFLCVSELRGGGAGQDTTLNDYRSARLHNALYPVKNGDKITVIIGEGGLWIANNNANNTNGGESSISINGRRIVAVSGGRKYTDTDGIYPAPDGNALFPGIYEPNMYNGEEKKELTESKFYSLQYPYSCFLGHALYWPSPYEHYKASASQMYKKIHYNQNLAYDGYARLAFIVEEDD